MTTEKFKNMLQARPFKRFVLSLADGEKVVVEHPDFANLTPSGRSVIVFEKLRPGEEDEHFKIIDLLLVTSLEPVRNGKPKRRAP